MTIDPTMENFKWHEEEIDKPLLPNGFIRLANQIAASPRRSIVTRAGDYFFAKRRVDNADGEITRIFDVRIGDLLFDPRMGLYWQPYVALSDIYKCRVWQMKPSRYEIFRQYLYNTFGIPLPKEEDED